MKVIERETEELVLAVCVCVVWVQERGEQRRFVCMQFGSESERKAGQYVCVCAAGRKMGQNEGDEGATSITFGKYMFT